jgi:hypothetical protein
LKIRLLLIAFTLVSLVTLNTVQAFQQPGTVSNKSEDQKQNNNTNNTTEEDHVIENNLLPLPDVETEMISPLPLPENPPPLPKLVPYTNLEKEESKRFQEEMDIYGTFESENSWVSDPREPENLFRASGSVVQIKVLSISEAKILPKTEDFYTDRPFTPIEVTIQETIDGNPLSGKKTIYVQGGDLRISNLVESWDKNRVSLLGINKLTKEEQESKFMSFTSEYDYEMEPGKEYAIILAKQQTEGEIYTVTARGYGIFEIDETKNGGKIYRNVITGRYYPTLVFSDKE